MNAGTNILIIDDDPLFLESNKDLLEAYGYSVSTALSGREGFAKAKELHPDLIILDVMMETDVAGFETARLIRAEQAIARTPILMVTGVKKEKGWPFDLEPDKNWLPVNRIFEKPVDPTSLLTEIKALLEA